MLLVSEMDVDLVEADMSADNQSDIDAKDADDS